MRLVGVMVGVAVVLGVAQVNASPLDQPFAASPTELLASAQTAPAGDWPVVILHEDLHVTVDERHRATRRWRVVYVVRTEDGVDEWGSVAASWSPFFQDRPVLRARVIAPGGRSAELDPRTISDEPVALVRGVATDRRRLEAPLPALQIGSVVEREIVWTDRVPQLVAGTTQFVELGNDVPTQRTLASITVLGRRAPRVLEIELPRGVKPRVERDAARQVWSYELGPLPSNPGREPYAPGDVRVGPYVAVATAGSWNAIAREYRHLIDARIAAGPVTLPPELSRTPTLASARAITAWLHRRVRWSGIGLGQSSNVPVTPAETLARGIGGTIDKATLLVALLRQARIPAELALLDIGFGADLHPELPGASVFDHVVVRARVAGRDVWIEPGSDLLDVGRLSPGVAGRRALIVAEGTTNLTKTPGLQPADNVVREVRTFELAETGPATRVTEVSRMHGVFATRTRAWIRDTEPDKVASRLAEYARGEYRAASLERHATTAAEDLDTPFEQTVVARRSSRAYTDRAQIEIELFPGDTLDELPELFDDEEWTGSRRTDLVWPTPHVYEIENRLVVPHGYTMPAPAPARTRRFGTVSFTERHRIEARVFVVTFRFETGVRTTPAQFTSVVKGIAQLRDERVDITIPHTGWSLAVAGKPREALAEIDRLIASHPTAAVHHTQRAFVLFRVGLGFAARRAAREAIALEPDDADAQVVLGWVLRHDTLGREYGFDHDRAGAIAAYRRARALDPTHAGAVADLATLLQHDEHGRLFGPGADLAGAIDAWRAARELEPTEPAHANSLMLALLVAGRFAELEATARELPASTERDSVLIAAVGATTGPAAARDLASTLASGTARDVRIDAAAALLLVARAYDPARALALPGGELRKTPHHQAVLDQLQRHVTPLRPADPKSVVHEWLHQITGSRPSRDIYWDAEVEQELHRARNQATLQLPFSMHGYIEDAMRSAFRWRVQSLASGLWRVELDAFDSTEIAYVALDKGATKLLGYGPFHRGVGRHALTLLARGDRAAARGLLAAVRADLEGASGVKAAAVAAIWDAAPDQPATLELVAATLAESSHGLPALRRCQSTAATARLTCDIAMTFALLRAGNWAELERITQAWLERDPTNRAIRAARIETLANLRRFDEAGRLVADALAADPDDREVLAARAMIAAARGDWSTANAQHDALLRRTPPREGDLNNAAWFRLTSGQDLARARELARQADAIDPAKTGPNALHTIAAIEAELGDLVAAKYQLDRAMERDKRHQPSGGDWYVIGRIAEQLGLRDDAIAAYRRVPSPSRLPLVPGSYELARRRLNAMRAP
jgi:tetratricopeptide (TPR) repeat protein/transglutaminase-like putative cysteine protease